MSPYESLPASAFWRSGVVESDPNRMEGLYKKKFDIARTDWIATAGSCFAQHIARHLRSAGFRVLDVEPPPKAMTEETARAFGYRLFSARYGNIYTSRQLLQLLQEVTGKGAPVNIVWERNGRFFDALRPSVEPDGFASPEEVEIHRRSHLRHVERMLQKTNVFIFTFGLTEAWTDRESGTVYPTAPGTIAGHYDPGVFTFRNFTFREIYNDFVEVRSILKQLRPKIRFVVTVSPVPLTATASGRHVLAATAHSKSILRAVAGQLEQEFDDVDYFPSYEIITNPAVRSGFFCDNLRSIDQAGVAAAMHTFMSGHLPDYAGDAPAALRAPADKKPPRQDNDAEDELVCEEMMLESFAGGRA
jgi:GSCFA family protein